MQKGYRRALSRRTGRSAGATPGARTPEKIDGEAGRQSYVAQLHTSDPSRSVRPGQNKSRMREQFSRKAETGRAATEKGDGAHI